MDLTRQSPRAASIHEQWLLTGEKTCIDCHKGIAHRLPHIPPGEAPTDTPGQVVPKDDDTARALPVGGAASDAGR